MLADLTTRTRRLIAEMSKEEHSVFPACSDAAIRLSVILFLSEVTTGFLIPPDISYERFHPISEHDFLHVEVPFFSELTLKIIPHRQQILVIWTTRPQNQIPHHTKVIAINY